MKIIGNIYGAGIYGICNTNKKKVLYVGSSIELNNALSRHKSNLKRKMYKNTNKDILQKEYNKNNLTFVVIKNINSIDKKKLKEQLSENEEYYINLYRETLCNKQNSVTWHTSSPSSITTYRRIKANIGSNNPRCKYDEKEIAEILWLKEELEMSVKEISNLYTNIPTNYIYAIGNTKWKYLKPQQPSFVKAIS